MKLNSLSIIKEQEGAVIVEYAIALIPLFFFFTVFFQMVMIFIGHERLSYANFVASRIASVEYARDEETPIAYSSSYAVDGETDLEITNPGGGMQLLIKTVKFLILPIDFESIYTQGGIDFEIGTSVYNFKEEEIPSSDNSS